jgi:hypothetical protein
MRSSVKRVELSVLKRRPAYRTVEGWALGTLLEHGAVRECEYHGHMRDRSDPEAWNRARDYARENPFPATSAEASVQAIDDVVRSIGDTCPDCD